MHKAQRGGTGGARELRRRIRLFDEGSWDVLLDSSRRTAVGRRPARQLQEAAELEARVRAATALVEVGELSHAARVLRSPGLASGNADTLVELRDLDRRPPNLQTALPPDAVNFQPRAPLRVDPEVFANVLLTARRGLAAGPSGQRYEYLKLALEDDASLDALTDVASLLAQGRVPTDAVDALALSQLSTLKKSNGRVRGIAVLLPVKNRTLSGWRSYLLTLV